MKYLLPFLALLVLVLVAGCMSTQNLTVEEKREVYRAYLAEANAYVMESKPIAQLYVDKGKIKQEEMTAAYVLLEEVAIPLFAAAIEKDDMAAWSSARAKVVLAIAKIVIMLTLDDDSPEAAPESAATPVLAESREVYLPRAPRPPPLPEDF